MTPPWWNLTTPPTVAVLSEPMTDVERAAFVQRFGYQPTHLRVALNAVAIVVHRDNPVPARGLTLAELDAVFSTTRVHGHAPLEHWGELGFSGAWSPRAISLYGHDASASLFVYFRRQVLAGGAFKASVVRQPSSAAVVDAVGHDPNAIGYAGISFVSPAVAVVPLAPSPDQAAVAPTPDNILDQRYPLAFFVHLYLNWQPGGPLDAPRRELLRFLYSRQGQQVVANYGYVPLPAAVAAQELQHLGIPRRP